MTMTTEPIRNLTPFEPVTRELLADLMPPDIRVILVECSFCGTLHRTAVGRDAGEVIPCLAGAWSDAFTGEPVA